MTAGTIPASRIVATLADLQAQLTALVVNPLGTPYRCVCRSRVVQQTVCAFPSASRTAEVASGADDAGIAAAAS